MAAPHRSFAIPPRPLLTALFDAAVQAADPAVVLARHLPDRPANGRCVVVGAGKAAARMAAALEAAWPEPPEGLVVTRYGHGYPTRAIRVVEAGHPLPDANGLAAAEAMLALVAPLRSDDLVIALISGGGSALLPAPPQGMTLDDEIAVQRALLASGAPIWEINTVRRSLSRIKGGRLAAATRARVATLVISDVPGDDAAQVASGPTLPDASTHEEARAIIARRGIVLPDAALHILARDDTRPPRPDDPRLARNSHRVIASASLSLAAAAAQARAQGIDAVVVSDRIEGESAQVAQAHARLALEMKAQRGRDARPLVLLSGGETSVTLSHNAGLGGRNTAFALSFGRAIAGEPGLTLLAADTDGIDGSGENAGAFADGQTCARIAKAGGDAAALLEADCSHTAMDLAGDLFTSGPTGTNVNDFRAILIG